MFPETRYFSADVVHNITIPKWLDSTYDSFEISKEQFLPYIVGIVPEDYLIELELLKEPVMSNIGFYASDEENLEHSVLEYCIDCYYIDDVTAIYIGDFYHWKSIQKKN